jgi:hypothetical protein
MILTGVGRENECPAAFLSEVLDKAHKERYFLNIEALNEESRMCRDGRELAAGASQYQGHLKLPREPWW